MLVYWFFFSLLDLGFLLFWLWLSYGEFLSLQFTYTSNAMLVLSSMEESHTAATADDGQEAATPHLF
ncbi:hypothetical protein HanRHA438_Chr17g0794861 [Helianthus annuus]|nr:hypothetical protein HanLR1_Chr17g0650071 [Helianthus annuus]KAJ0634953.1 hypothetical protein HanOQP8_Chr17g0645601 [Helianthus annuus]KAJ0824663.1 hypothetical protein HanRHA438_Chr17g0794861 [Helianthus annuus]